MRLSYTSKRLSNSTKKHWAIRKTRNNRWSNRSYRWCSTDLWQYISRKEWPIKTYKKRFVLKEKRAGYAVKICNLQNYLFSMQAFYRPSYEFSCNFCSKVWQRRLHRWSASRRLLCRWFSSSPLLYKLLQRLCSSNTLRLCPNILGNFSGVDSLNTSQFWNSIQDPRTFPYFRSVWRTACQHLHSLRNLLSLFCCTSLACLLRDKLNEIKRTSLSENVLGPFLYKHSYSCYNRSHGKLPLDHLWRNAAPI